MLAEDDMRWRTLQKIGWHPEFEEHLAKLLLAGRVEVPAGVPH